MIEPSMLMDTRQECGQLLAVERQHILGVTRLAAKLQRPPQPRAWIREHHAVIHSSIQKPTEDGQDELHVAALQHAELGDQERLHLVLLNASDLAWSEGRLNVLLVDGPVHLA